MNAPFMPQCLKGAFVFGVCKKRGQTPVILAYDDEIPGTVQYFRVTERW
jgi:hypothetical protein